MYKPEIMKWKAQVAYYADELREAQAHLHNAQQRVQAMSKHLAWARKQEKAWHNSYKEMKNEAARSRNAATATAHRRRNRHVTWQNQGSNNRQRTQAPTRQGLWGRTKAFLGRR